MKHRKTLTILAALATVGTVTACNPSTSKVRGEIIDIECDLTISQNGKRTEVELDAKNEEVPPIQTDSPALVYADAGGHGIVEWWADNMSASLWGRDEVRIDFDTFSDTAEGNGLRVSEDGEYDPYFVLDRDLLKRWIRILLTARACLDSDETRAFFMNADPLSRQDMT